MWFGKVRSLCKSLWTLEFRKSWNISLGSSRISCNGGCRWECVFFLLPSLTTFLLPHSSLNIFQSPATPHLTVLSDLRILLTCGSLFVLSSQSHPLRTHTANYFFPGSTPWIKASWNMNYGKLRRVGLFTFQLLLKSKRNILLFLDDNLLHDLNITKKSKESDLE